MSEERFDIIVVGGGLAGTAAAYRLAKEGLDVLVVERGTFCGSKNMTGGRLYGHSLEKLIPGFAKVAPVERKIVKEKVSMMTASGATTLEYTSDKLNADSCASYTVLRSKFDKWFAAQAEEAGAMYVCGSTVDRLIKEEDKVVGIVSGEDEVYADVVILADGVNSLLAQQIGLKKELKPEQVAVGVKEVIQLDEQTISERFSVKNGEGTAWMFAGYPTDGNLGGAFLYTNKDSVSLGIVATISDIGRTDTSVPDMVEHLKEHPVIAPLIRDGKTVEYSAHLVSEGGYAMIPRLYDNGVLVVGDAAAMVINMGFTVRGMDLAIESGRLAAEAVLEARKQEDYSAEILASYEEKLKESFVLQDMKRYQKFPELMEKHELFNEYPVLAEELLAGLFCVDGDSSRSILGKAIPPFIKSGGLLTLAKIGMGALNAI